MDENEKRLNAQASIFQDVQKLGRTFAVDGVELVKVTELKFLKEENKRLREALTPSVATKFAYSMEDEVTFWRTEFEEDGHEVRIREIVPWITIKTIMKMILARADSARTAPSSAEASLPLPSSE